MKGYTMKTFTVNKDSWHYKLNFEMCKTNDRLYKPELVHKFIMSKDNLCSYWRMTLWGMFKVAVVVAFALTVAASISFMIYLYGYALMFHTTEALVGTGVVVSLLVIIVSIVSIHVWFEERKRIKLNKILNDGETETSLAKAQYSSWKSGVCVPVEFKQ